jgi:tRNA pseudouridine38-40 synthase
MKNIAIAVKFDGSAYHGWQSQKNAVALQDVISEAIYKTTGEKPYPELTGCGRTDAGVHAVGYVANFKTDMRIPEEKFPLAILPKLPPDVSVVKAREVPPDFHARFSCLKKEYVYKIYHQNVPDPFLNRRAYFHPYPLDIDKMKKAAAYITGRHDFSAFRATGSAVKDCVRTVFSCEIKKKGKSVEIVVTADGFLYNMVRIISGTLLYVSDGKISADDMPAILESGDRTLAGITLPPHGLYLNRVWYGGKPGINGIGKGNAELEKAVDTDE